MNWGSVMCPKCETFAVAFLAFKFQKEKKRLPTGRGALLLPFNNRVSLQQHSTDAMHAFESKKRRRRTQRQHPLLRIVTSFMYRNKVNHDESPYRNNSTNHDDPISAY